MLRLSCLYKNKVPLHCQIFSPCFYDHMLYKYYFYNELYIDEQKIFYIIYKKNI